ncbi:hypothetical protein, partial [Acinetobacter sp. TUM15509]|uniref:hypothetical protein n=1 Tax=Acinetobacter sp. TUM15509 TaxID=2609154 RepID=UPI001C09F68D
MDKCTKKFTIQIGIIFIFNIFLYIKFDTISALWWVVIATCFVVFNHVFFKQEGFKKLNVLNWIIYFLFMILIFYVGSKYGKSFDVFPYPVFILSAFALAKKMIKS